VGEDTHMNIDTLMDIFWMIHRVRWVNRWARKSLHSVALSNSVRPVEWTVIWDVWLNQSENWRHSCEEASSGKPSSSRHWSW